MASEWPLATAPAAAASPLRAHRHHNNVRHPARALGMRGSRKLGSHSSCRNSSSRQQGWVPWPARVRWGPCLAWRA